MANPSYLALSAMRGSVLASTRLTGTTATTVYTAPANSTVKIASAVVANTTPTPVAVTVSLVPTGGTAGATNQIIPSFIVPAAGDPDSGGAVSLKDFLAGAMLGEGDFISVTAGTANAIVVALTGAVSS